MTIPSPHSGQHWVLLPPAIVVLIVARYHVTGELVTIVMVQEMFAVQAFVSQFGFSTNNHIWFTASIVSEINSVSAVVVMFKFFKLKLNVKIILKHYSLYTCIHSLYVNYCLFGSEM